MEAVGYIGYIIAIRKKIVYIYKPNKATPTTILTYKVHYFLYIGIT